MKLHFGTSRWGGTRKRPRAFTEQGVAMPSSVLRSPRAAHVNIEIMRAFVRLRERCVPASGAKTMTMTGTCAWPEHAAKVVGNRGARSQRMLRPDHHVSDSMGV